MARIDLRIDDDLLSKIQEIAKEQFKAKVHHISKNPEITPTLIKLLQYGIEYLESGLNKKLELDSLPDTYLDQIAEKVLERILPILPVSNMDSYLDDLVMEKQEA